MEFGAHVSSSGGIDTAIDRIAAIGGDCVQVFTQSPRMWRPTNHKPEAIQAFHYKRAEHGIGGVVCHALYLCNLAAPDDEIYRKSVEQIQQSLRWLGIDWDGPVMFQLDRFGVAREHAEKLVAEG